MATVAPIKPVQKIAEDDGVREVHGIVLSDARIVLDEHHGIIRVDLGSYSRASITPAKARHLASKLYRLARRIERREVGQ